MSGKCYKFAEYEWKEFANLKQKRAYAAGIVFEENFHIFGGTGGEYNRLKSTEIVSATGVVSYGPNMTTEFYGHAITKVNETVSILSGGETNSGFFTKQTWYYNHKSQQFSDGPVLLKGRGLHASGTIYCTIFGKHSIYIRTVRHLLLYIPYTRHYNPH